MLRPADAELGKRNECDDLVLADALGVLADLDQPIGFAQARNKP